MPRLQLPDKYAADLKCSAASDTTQCRVNEDGVSLCLRRQGLSAANGNLDIETTVDYTRYADDRANHAASAFGSRTSEKRTRVWAICR